MKIIKIVLLISLLNSVVALSNGLALTPPLIFVPRTEACQTDEAVVLRQADLLLSLGLASKGYKYVTIEPCWQVLMSLFRAKEIKMEEFKKM
jgi:hypothetical protein